jgi:hypothetical protein
MMRSARAFSRVAAACCVAVASLMLLAAAALAHGPREVGSFSLPEVIFGGIAVEQSSQDVFSVDASKGVVEKRAPGGTTVLGEFGAGETPAKEFNHNGGAVAIDQAGGSPSEGDVYVAEGSGGVVDKFRPKAGKPNEYEYVCQFTGPGLGCVREGAEPETAFGFSLGVTVDAEGNVYVACFSNRAVYEFDAGGNYLGELVGEDIGGPSGVTTGPAKTLYVTKLGGDTVKVIVNTSHKVVSESVLDPHQTGGAAYDPTTGDVYVTDLEGGSHVVVYGPNGKVVEEFAHKELGEAAAIAYSAQDHRTYVVDRTRERVVVFAEPPVTEVEPASNVSSSAATLTGMVDPEGPSAEWYFEYGVTTSYGSTTAPGDVTSTGKVSAMLEGLRPGTLYHYRLVGVNSRGAGTSTDGTFRTTAHVEDLPALGVSQFFATLEATIDPGLIPASYHFAYGTTSAYGSVAPVPDLYAVPGYADDKVSQLIAGLRPGTTYHYALVAADVAGIVTGADETFTTPPVPAPVAVTGSVVEVSRSTASVTGTVDPVGWDTTYHFEYGTSTAYGSSWPTVDVDMGALTGFQPVRIELQNLQPGTTYHYRLVATNPGGTSYGTDQTFTTGEYPVSVIQPNPVGGPLGIAPAASKPKAKSKAHRHPNTKHKKRKPKKK